MAGWTLEPKKIMAKSRSTRVTYTYARKLMGEEPSAESCKRLRSTEQSRQFLKTLFAVEPTVVFFRSSAAFGLPASSIYLLASFFCSPHVLKSCWMLSLQVTRFIHILPSICLSAFC